MGHIRLGRLPRTRVWRDVVAALDMPTATEGDIADRTFAAAASYLRRIGAREAGCYRPLFELTRLTVASRSAESFWKHLRELGISDAKHLDGVQLLRSVAMLASSQGQSGPRTALSDVADQASRETILTHVRGAADTLWGVTPDDVRLAFKSAATKQGFSDLARHWFGQFVGRALLYFLDRELPNHVGGRGPVSTPADAVHLERALLGYAHERTQIIRDFAPGWLSKTLWKEGTLSPEAARRFYAYCIRKITADIESEDYE